MTIEELNIDDILFKTILKNLIGVNKKTHEKAKNAHMQISVHYSVYLDLFQPVYLDFNSSELSNSLFKYRFLEFEKQFQWLYFNIMSGSYHQSIRELRYILESMIQAYYIDKNHPNASMGCKMEILKEVELYGFNLISKTSDLTRNNRRKLNKLYSNLSKHVHSSYEKLNPVFENGEFQHSINFKYNERMLLECIELFQETFDAILLMIFLYDSDITSKFTESFIETFKKNGYELAYSSIMNQDR